MDKSSISSVSSGSSASAVSSKAAGADSAPAGDQESERGGAIPRSGEGPLRRYHDMRQAGELHPDAAHGMLITAYG